MLILGLDTATEAVCAAVLDSDTDEVRARASFVGQVAHGEQLAPVVERVLTEARVRPEDLGAIGVGRGPGPYTGLRVGLVHAEVLGWALGIPVHGVCTLDVLAAQAVGAGLGEEFGAGEFLVVTDARRREVYWARYDARGRRLAGPSVDRAADIVERGLPAVGAGAAHYPESFADRRQPMLPDAGVLATLAAAFVRDGVTPDVSPLYLRRPDAVAASTRKRVTPA